MLQSLISTIAYTDPGPSDSMIAYSANVASYNLYLTNTGKERVRNRSTAKFRRSINQGEDYQHYNLSLLLHSITSFTLFLFSWQLFHFSGRDWQEHPHLVYKFLFLQNWNKSIILIIDNNIISIFSSNHTDNVLFFIVI